MTEPIEYTNDMDDLVQFHRDHLKTSKAGKRTLLTTSIGMGAIFLLSYFLVSAATGDPRLPIWTLIAAVGLIVVGRPLTIWSTARTARRMYGDGRNKGALGWHRLSITDDSLTEECESGSTQSRFDSIERVVDSGPVVYIYLGALLAHVVPKDKITRGDISSFVAALQSRVPSLAV
jgi:hypothetical protein